MLCLTIISLGAPVTRASVMIHACTLMRNFLAGFHIEQYKNLKRC